MAMLGKNRRLMEHGHLYVSMEN